MTDAAADLDRRVEAFEEAWAGGVPPDLAAFLPPKGDPQFLPVLAELVRVDLEFRQRSGWEARLELYQSTFPALFADTSLVRELAFEEYRLRAASGERTHPDEYARRYGIDTSGWPAPHSSRTPTAVLPDLSGSGSQGQSHFPELGENVQGYKLIAELGRGSFGRVYLAEESGLAGRRVAVKLTTRFGLAEPETLARLQHTHIVPVYSTHRAGPFQLVVMPFLGTATLADLLTALHGRGSWPVSGRDLADTLAARKSHTLTGSHAPGDDPNAPAESSATGTAVVLRLLARFTYPEAILWIGARLADALAHAHERGVLHRDLKPANVLLTDEGQPMLLDFNLAADAARGRSRNFGGTPTYMSPEQLRGMLGGPGTVDQRSDVFSLGVVLFELLTGRHPFPPSADVGPDPVLELLRRRSGPAPLLHTLSPAVTPSTEAIVRRCLERDPERRYPTARALAEDLDRQLAHQPLAHTREPSVRERLWKWRRRHPRLTSTGTVAALAGILVLLLAGAFYARHEQVKRLEDEQAATQAREAAVDKYQAFRRDGREAVALLTVRGHDPQKLVEGEEKVRSLLARYAVPGNPEWASEPDVKLLPDADRQELRWRVAEMLLVLARVGADRAMKLPPGPGRDAGLNAALGLIDRAMTTYDPGNVPRTAWADRAEVLARLGRSEEVARLHEGELRVAPTTARDYYLAGSALVARGHYGEAVRALEEATARDPRQFRAWFDLGVAYAGLGRDAQAEGCFNACVALEPEYPMGYFNRGLSRLRRNLFAQAEADFTTTLQLDPKLSDALVNRALARLGSNRPAEAAADLTKALELGSTETRLYFLRADARSRAGDKAGAAADRATALAREPADEVSWVARGLARADSDPAGALADFDEALKLNPRSFPALQNKAFVLSEKLNRADDAIAVLGQAIELYPDALPARAGHAVLLARKGDRAAAHRDAERCLAQGPGADIVYQLAGVYALSSKKNPEDARTAFRLLADALRQGYGFDLVAIDTDLDPLRTMPEFRTVLEAARAVRGVLPNR